MHPSNLLNKTAVNLTATPEVVTKALAIDDPYRRAIIQAVMSRIVNGSTDYEILQKGLARSLKEPIFKAVLAAKFDLFPPITVDQVLDRLYWNSSFHKWKRFHTVLSRMGKDLLSGQIITSCVVHCLSCL